MRNCFVVVLCLMAASPARAENWPQFRGPTGQGISNEKSLPMRWSSHSNLVWQTAIPGEGWSSPIIWNDKIFITCATEQGTMCRVIAVDRKSGKVIWNKDVFEQVPLRKEGKNSYATPTPVTDGKRVYAVFGDGSVAALTLEGHIVWTNRDVQFYSRHGLGASPIVHGDLLIMPYDGSNRVGAPGNYPNNTAEERLGWQIPWDRSFVAALDVNILSFQMMGEDQPSPGIAVCQTRFEWLLQRIGRLFSFEIPCPVGPRNCGQFSARAGDAAIRQSTTTKQFRISRVFKSHWPGLQC